MSVFFTSDLHLGHSNIIKYDNRPFKDISEMDEAIIQNWNKIVSPNDIVYILGDISWYDESRTYERISRLNGHKHLIIGNHDKKLGKVKNLFESIKDYKEIRVDNNTFIMSHYPIHFYNHQYHGAIMLYGHVHNNKDEHNVQEAMKLINKNGVPCKMVNVGITMWDYKPVSISQIVNYPDL